MVPGLSKPVPGAPKRPKDSQKNVDQSFPTERAWAHQRWKSSVGAPALFLSARSRRGRVKGFREDQWSFTESWFTVYTGGARVASTSRSFWYHDGTLPGMPEIAREKQLFGAAFFHANDPMPGDLFPRPGMHRLHEAEQQEMAPSHLFSGSLGAMVELKNVSKQVNGFYKLKLKELASPRSLSDSVMAPIILLMHGRASSWIATNLHQGGSFEKHSAAVTSKDVEGFHKKVGKDASNSHGSVWGLVGDVQLSYRPHRCAPRREKKIWPFSWSSGIEILGPRRCFGSLFNVSDHWP